MSSPDPSVSSGRAAQIEEALKGIEELLLEAAADLVEGKVDERTRIPPEVIQKMLELGTRLYSIELQSGRKVPPFRPEHAVAATDVMLTSSAMLKAVNIQLFELGMWQMWAPR